MKFCDCITDGYCSRYGRIMSGRFREICAGKNVDLGTAAAFRDQWLREAGHLQQVLSGRISRYTTNLILQTNQAPGDAVVATAAIYSLHRAHPGKFRTVVHSPYPEVFENNPDIASSEEIGRWHELRMHYPAIHDSNRRGIHVMQAFCEHLGKALDIDVPLLTNRPHLFLKDGARPQEELGDYWLICSGGKSDFTNKLWGRANYQQVVDLARDRVTFVQVGGNERDHPPLRGVASRVGSTSLQQLFQLVRGSRGVLCGVTLLMHVAAAFDKPAVVIAGGREPVQWNAYPKQHYLHTVGMLPCTDKRGESGACWRSRVAPQGDCAALDEYLCLRPVQYTYAKVPLYTIPECMTLISPEQVADLILKIDENYHDQVMV